LSVHLHSSKMGEGGQVLEAQNVYQGFTGNIAQNQFEVQENTQDLFSGWKTVLQQLKVSLFCSMGNP
uniref:hypothetical protein n=1 Tax=Roseivirga sp. TaxID=1964215 RepID=UPI004047809F